MDQMVDLESGTNHELNEPAPGMWRYPTNPDLCCIYRVPNCLRQVNPEAYTPQLVIIGPLHHSLKLEALKNRGDITKAKSMAYLNMEVHKKVYIASFARKVQGMKAIDEFRRIIEEEEERIRASYSDSTAWIPSSEFVDMILHDSVFILEIFLRIFLRGSQKIGDPLMDQSCLDNTVRRDLILLENQLPFFILEKLFDPIVSILSPKQSFRELTLTLFQFEEYIENNSKFRHFTDLFRRVRVETFPDHDLGMYKPMYVMYNADKLHTGGVKFKAVEDKFSVLVKFDNGVLEVPCFEADEDVEMELRNIMALEQCHYPLEAHVCNYIMFLDFLIDTHMDVDLLVEKGIISNLLGDHRSVAKIVNKLSLGVKEDGSYYSGIAEKVLKYHKSRYNKTYAILKRVYFSNLWTGTATVVAMFLLLLTLIQTVTSIIEVTQ